MLEKLIETKQLTVQEAEEYHLFACTEAGKKWLDRRKEELFLEQPDPSSMTEINMIFIDGRRSLIREVLFTVKHVQSLIKEIHDDRPE